MDRYTILFIILMIISFCVLIAIGWFLTDIGILDWEPTNTTGVLNDRLS